MPSTMPAHGTLVVRSLDAPARRLGLDVGRGVGTVAFSTNGFQRGGTLKAGLNPPNSPAGPAVDRICVELIGRGGWVIGV